MAGVSRRLLLAAFSTLAASAAFETRLAAQGAAKPPSSERVALNGYDPVAYFVDSKAVMGRPDLELRLAGATWRFCNEGNRGAFAAAPAVYIPRFGGHDPMSVGRGASAAGHPEIWAIVNRRLYLFFNETARNAFVCVPEPAISAAASSGLAQRVETLEREVAELKQQFESLRRQFE